jgi:hypothetical protein
MADLCNYQECIDHHSAMARLARAVVSNSNDVADYLDALFIRYMHESLGSGAHASLANQRAIAIQQIKLDLFGAPEGVIN